MGVALVDFANQLKVELSVPGEDPFPDAIEDDYDDFLRGGFWDARRAGLLGGFTEDDGVVTPRTGSVDISRDEIQLVIFLTAIKIVRNQLRSLKTQLDVKAGSASYSYQQSSLVLRELLKDLINERDTLIGQLSTTYGSGTSVHYIDAATLRGRFWRPADMWDC